MADQAGKQDQLTVATGLVTVADVQCYLTRAADPAFLYPTPILVSA
jgi:hypothetical protein